MTATKYDEYLERGRRAHGERFSAASLAPQFVHYYNSGERIRVRTSYGEELTGTVGATTGWIPCFLLMRRSNARGSCDTLSATDTVVAIKRGREYVPVSNPIVREG